MKKLVDKILPRLFISMLMMASVLCTRLAVESKTDINCRTADIKNSTEKDHNHDVAGNRRAAQLPANIFLNPNHNCYTQFFIQGTPPTGLRTQHLNQMRYICQERPNVPGTYYYATMHDERLGIAVYSAYVLRAGNINFQAQGASAWVQTPGIQNQGSNAAYHGQPCHRGHLYPAQTASGNPANAADSVRSTYQYTNAVPQCGTFNTGQWSQFEGYIRAYAVHTCIPAGGELYLVTGSSFVGIQGPNNPQPVAVQITTLPGGIYKPGSMWTAGTCICANGLSESFAVIGNNLPVSATQEISQAQLLVILNFDIQQNALKRSRGAQPVNLFPRVRSATPITLPREEYPPVGRPSRSSYRKACSKRGVSSSSNPPKSSKVVPSSKPSSKIPSSQPSKIPSSQPSKKPSSKPSKKPSSNPHASTSHKSKPRPVASSSRRKSG